MQSNAITTFLSYAATLVSSLVFLAIAVSAFGECYERNRRRKLGLEAYNE